MAPAPASVAHHGSQQQSSALKVTPQCECPLRTIQELKWAFNALRLLAGNNESSRGASASTRPEINICLRDLLLLIYSSDPGCCAVQPFVSRHHLIRKLQRDPSPHRANLCFWAEISPCALSECLSAGTFKAYAAPHFLFQNYPLATFALKSHCCQNDRKAQGKGSVRQGFSPVSAKKKFFFAHHA